MKSLYFQWILLALLFSGSLVITGQDLKDFYIEVDPVEFDNIYENYTENIYIPVLLTFDGNTWTEVRMRIRGDSSREYPKKSLKVVFEGDPFITGEMTLNFNAEYHDLSYMHSYLSSVMFEQANQYSAKQEHVNLYINGNFFGLYVIAENLDERFLTERGFNPNGNLYKATKDRACLSIYDNIFYDWELKSGDDPYMDDLAELIVNLNQPDDDGFSSFVKSSFDYDNLLGFFALNMLLSNASTYYHNYFLYHDIEGSGKWFIFPWDLDWTFSDYGKWLHYTRSSGTWSPDNPLLERSIYDEEILADIYSKLLNYHAEFFNEGFIYPLIDSLSSCLLNSVLADTTDDIHDLNTWHTKIELDRTFINERYNYLLHQMNNHPRNFKVNRFDRYYEPNENITFSWMPSTDPNDDEISYSLYYGKDIKLEDPSTIVIQDIEENFYSLNQISEEGKYFWKVEATAGGFTITGFDSYNQLFIYNEIPTVVINEINYNSHSNFDTDDWVELYNVEETNVDLSGWIFRDENNQHFFTIPGGTIIAPESYLVLCRDTAAFFTFFPDSINAIGNLDFGFSSNGELLRLHHYSEYLVDSLVYRPESPWPEEPNGNGPTLELFNPNVDNAQGVNWRASSIFGTPGQKNSSYSPDAIEDWFTDEQNSLHIYPNPFSDEISIKFYLDKDNDVQINIFDEQGTLVSSIPCGILKQGQHDIKVNLSEKGSGLLIFQLCDGDGKCFTQLIIKN